MTPSLTIYTDNLPAHAGGMTRGPFIFIRPKYRGDIGLLEHEKMHVAQWWIVTLLAVAAILAIGHLGYGLPLLQAASYAPVAIGVYSLLYEMVPPFRLWAEVQAYRKQLSYYPDRNERAVVLGRFLAEKYGLKITVDEAIALLRS